MAETLQLYSYITGNVSYSGSYTSADLVFNSTNDLGKAINARRARHLQLFRTCLITSIIAENERKILFLSNDAICFLSRAFRRQHDKILPLICCVVVTINTQLLLNM